MWCLKNWWKFKTFVTSQDSISAKDGGQWMYQQCDGLAQFKKIIKLWTPVLFTQLTEKHKRTFQRSVEHFNKGTCKFLALCLPYRHECYKYPVKWNPKTSFICPCDTSLMSFVRIMMSLSTNMEKNLPQELIDWLTKEMISWLTTRWWNKQSIILMSW